MIIEAGQVGTDLRPSLAPFLSVRFRSVDSDLLYILSRLYAALAGEELECC